jgi:hypothetical protein
MPLKWSEPYIKNSSGTRLYSRTGKHQWLPFCDMCGDLASSGQVDFVWNWRHPLRFARSERMGCVLHKPAPARIDFGFSSMEREGWQLWLLGFIGVGTLFWFLREMTRFFRWLL